MRSIKINKIAAIGLLVVIGLSIMVAQGLTGISPEYPPGRTVPENIITSVRVEISIPFIPNVGEVFEATLTIYCKSDLEIDRIGPDYKVIFEESKGVEIIEGQGQVFHGYMKKGEERQFRARVMITESMPTVVIGGSIVTIRPPQFAQGIGVEIFLLDPETGQYGTKEEWLNTAISVFWKYNNVEPQWFSEPDQTWEASNRKIAEEMRKFESALSDSEALCLHQDNYLLIINAVGDPNATDKERIEHLLEAGWLDAQRSGAEAKENWFNEFMQKNRGRWGGNSNLNFFRDNNSIDNDFSSGNNSSPKERITTTFIGTWRYQDHLYNKDNGLLWSYAVKPVKTAEVGIRAYWSGQGQIFVGWGSTDSSGNFTITTELIPYGATNVRAFPILYAWGPERYNEKIKVSDPDTSISTWKNPRDRTIWWLPRPTGTPANYVTPGGTCNFSICYPETATAAITQPRSGAANILETYLHARTFMNPPPTRPLRVMWEPGYDTITSMNMTYPVNDDTVWVTANAVNPLTGYSTDEWDDDVLLHEFGHYLMKGYAQGPPSCTGPHTWSVEYPEKPGIGYGEGWAHFFSARARVGSGTDTLTVNTNKGIGAGSVYLWRNIENPWLGNDFTPPLFEGGPWCEGAVAGALWDIYDSHDEIPYPSYPYSGFPDTALADTLTVDFDTIWTVFDDYNPQGERTNCWTIFDFRSGWNSYNYGHQFALNQILLHHRIRDSIPAQPIGLGAELDNDYNVDLCWDKNSEPDLNGYRVFRRGKRTLGMSDWSTWGIIVENSSPTDTTHHDTTVVCRYTYEYKVTAYDSIGNESEFSDSVRIDIPQKDEDKNSPPFVRNSVIKDIRQLVLMVPEGSHVLIVKIYDCTGRVIDKQELTFEKGFSGSVNIYNRRGEHLPSGVYFVDIQNDNKQRVVEKIVIIK